MAKPQQSSDETDLGPVDKAPEPAPEATPEPTPIADIGRGKGGSYSRDPKTGVRTLIGRTQR